MDSLASTKYSRNTETNKYCQHYLLWFILVYKAQKRQSLSLMVSIAFYHLLVLWYFVSNICLCFLAQFLKNSKYIKFNKYSIPQTSKYSLIIEHPFLETTSCSYKYDNIPKNTETGNIVFDCLTGIPVWRFNWIKNKTWQVHYFRWE